VTSSTVDGESQTAASAGAGIEEDAQPSTLVRIEAGSPTDDELAAAHAVISAMLAEQEVLGAQRSRPLVDQWRAQARAGRPSITPGPGAWNSTRGIRGS
jgi:hypothetical protein